MAKERRNIPANASTPFEVDKTYFKNFEKDLLGKIDENTYHLPMGIPHPFKAPKNYFDSLDEIVLSKIDKEQTARGAPLFLLWQRYRYSLSIAASVILVSLFSLTIYLNNQDSTQQLNYSNSLAALETDDIVAYLEAENLNTRDFSLLLDENPEILNTIYFEEEEYDMNDYSDEDILELIDIQLDSEI